MSEWKKVKFLDYIELNPKVSIAKGEVCPFIEMANVDCNMRQPRCFEYKPFTSGVKFQTYDTVIARIEPCLQNGKGFLFTKQGVGFGSTEYLVFRAKPSKTIPLFVYYFMRTHKIKTLMCNSMSGATGRQRVNNDVFLNLEVDIPSYDEQQRIATILSRYDSLIENYQKQIKLLEESAQRLYKEWFIDLRFPGHENSKIVDGVPEGWEKKKISDVCDTIGGGTPSTKVQEYYEGGNISWVTPTDITRNNSLCLLSTEKKITQEGLDHSSAKMLPEETILMTSRASVGYFGICDFEVCTNQGFISCVPFKKNFQMYLLYNLINRVEEIRIKAGGSTYLEISKSVFRNFEIIKPSDDVLNSFQQNVHKIIDKVRCLSKQIRHLTEARDRLLPKLMNGEIEV